MSSLHRVPGLLLARLAAILGLAAVATGCASSGSTPHPFPMPRPATVNAPGGGAGVGPGEQPAVDTAEAAAPASPEGVSPAAAATRGDLYALVGTALELRGVPYRNGGAGPSGFDCSGFTQYVFARHGVALPREVRDQFKIGKKVKADDLLPGDLIFFTTTAPGASHVGIAIGGDAFVHAPSSTGVVRVERLGSRYWSPRFLGIRRVTAS
jgi:cell wall-associated NlpC family hydrolase